MESSNSYVLNKALKQCVCVCVCIGGGGACVTVCVCVCARGWGGTTETVQLWSCIYFPSHLTSMFCIQNCSIFVDINKSNMYTCTAKNKKQSSPLSLSLSSRSKDLIGNEWTWQTYCNKHNPHKVPSVLNPNCIAAWYKMTKVFHANFAVPINPKSTGANILLVQIYIFSKRNAFKKWNERPRTQQRITHLKNEMRDLAHSRG